MSLAESWKYDQAYKLENYRMGNARKHYALQDLGLMEKGQTMLDVGCGRGEIVRSARSAGILAKGIEGVKYLCDNEWIIHGDACNLPFEDQSFDWITCYDVMEHLPPGEEQLALDEFRRVAKVGVIISTNDRPSTLPDGTDLHVNKRPRDEWLDFLTYRWGYVEATDKGPHKDWHFVCLP